MMVVFLSLVNRVTIYCNRAFICCLAGWKISFGGKIFPIKREIHGSWELDCSYSLKIIKNNKIFFPTLNLSLNFNNFNQ